MLAKRLLFDKRAIEQFNGREGETATLLSRCLFNSELRVGGFAPRHLKRYAPFCIIERNRVESYKAIYFYLDFACISFMLRMQ